MLPCFQNMQVPAATRGHVTSAADPSAVIRGYQVIRLSGHQGCMHPGLVPASCGTFGIPNRDRSLSSSFNSRSVSLSVCQCVCLPLHRPDQTMGPRGSNYQRSPSSIKSTYPSLGVKMPKQPRFQRGIPAHPPRHAYVLKKKTDREGKKINGCQLLASAPSRGHFDVPFTKRTVQSPSRRTKQLIILSCQEDDDPFIGCPRVSPLPRDDGHERADHPRSKVEGGEKDASSVQSALMR